MLSTRQPRSKSFKSYFLSYHHTLVALRAAELGRNYVLEGVDI